MTELNVALIGYKFMGRAHSNAYRQVGPVMSPSLQPRMKVLCGRDAAAVGEAAGQLGWEESATDWREVVERDDIHLVDISTPGDSHAEIAIAAAKAGKAILCEKPLANTVEDAKAMLSAVETAGVVHMLCHNYRRIPAVMLAKQMIEAGDLGEIYHYRGTYLQDWVVDPELPLLWRFRKDKAGSGALGDIASHSLDLARFLVGEIAQISGELETFITERPLLDDATKKGRVSVDDAAIALVRFDNGALGTIEGTRLALGRKNYNRFEINGSKGSLAFDLERMNELEVYLESDPPARRGFRKILVTEPEHHPYIASWWPPGHIIGYEHTFVHTVYDLLTAIERGTAPRPNFEDGVRNQKVLAAWERSAESRRWEKV
ncbi:MAG: Gfo/Idh/MocA family oxidoreductase [Acidobacteriota bacterium]|nr:Gfo/Idh/MocA family oxidoreductase [Acidobacteriota bacterium]